MKNIKKEWAEEGYAFYDRMHPFKCLSCNRNFKDYPYFHEHVLRTISRLRKYYQNELRKSHPEFYPKDNDPDLIRRANERLHKSAQYQLLVKSIDENKNKRPFICNICHKNFRERQSLKGHYIRVHHIDVKNAIPKPSQAVNV